MSCSLPSYSPILSTRGFIQYTYILDTWPWTLNVYVHGNGICVVGLIPTSLSSLVEGNTENRREEGEKKTGKEKEEMEKEEEKVSFKMEKKDYSNIQVSNSLVS